MSDSTAYLVMLKPSEIAPYPNNPRLNDSAVDAVRASIRAYGFQSPMLVDEDHVIIAGHTRWKAAVAEGLDRVPVIVTDMDPVTAKGYRIADNKTGEAATWDDAALAGEFAELLAMAQELTPTGFSEAEIARLLGDDGGAVGGYDLAAGSLVDRFVVPPFSVLDCRQGYWRDRKRAWLALGIAGELGRDGLVDTSDTGHWFAKIQGRQVIDCGSVFDPVLCEIAYTWFCAPGGNVFDPFAGGSVRGIVAHKLGRYYTGIDIRAQQVAANNTNATAVLDADNLPTWVTGDSQNTTDLYQGKTDLVFTCPPYGNLEVYSDLDGDISRMDYAGFIQAFADVLAQCYSVLNDGRFMVLVVGDFRDKRGNYCGFVADTIKAACACGFSLYNDAVYLTPNVTAQLRVNKQFCTRRKLVKTHQNILVFVKGSAKAATAWCGEVDVADFDE